MTFLFWLILLLGLFLVAWVLGIKSRGSFYHWVRPFRTEPCRVVGRTFPAGTSSAEQSKFLFEANGFIRSKEKRSTVVIREWDHQAETIFVGLVLSAENELAATSEFEVRDLPAQSTIRVSGSAKTSNITPSESLKKYLTTHNSQVELTKPARISGQSFHLYQWQLAEDLPEPTWLQKTMEATFQLRDILIFPILLTIVAIGLLGTQQIILFPIGILLIILLSGAVKFVFLHQIADEAEEIHLQNY
ncbi:MAG: hypothetical protein ACSHYB_13140 [Roseibacillus sp.]